MVTTIQIRENVKEELDRLKERNQSYEEVIISLMRLTEQFKRKQEALLMEGCKEMAKDALKATKDWEATDSKLSWQW